MEKYSSSFRDSKRPLMKTELYFLYSVWLKEHADSGANNSIYLFIIISHINLGCKDRGFFLINKELQKKTLSTTISLWFKDEAHP